MVNSSWNSQVKICKSLKNCSSVSFTTPQHTRIWGKSETNCQCVGYLENTKISVKINLF